MSFTRFTDYALRVLVYLARCPQDWVTIRQVSDTHAISRNHLMKVVSFLGSKGYIVSQRGPGGGVRLATHPGDIRIADVVMDAEGGLDLLEQPEGLDEDLAQAHDRLIAVFEDAMDTFLISLNGYTLEDIISRPYQAPPRLRANA